MQLEFPVLSQFAVHILVRESGARIIALSIHNLVVFEPRHHIEKMHDRRRVLAPYLNYHFTLQKFTKVKSFSRLLRWTVYVAKSTLLQYANVLNI